MTEQPVETEEQFLGNHPRATTLADLPAKLEEFLAKPLLVPAAAPLQHYVPNAHLRRPAWTPVDDVELGALARKSINANKLLGIAKAKAVEAEEALKLALDVEEKAYEAVSEADKALVEFTRKGAGL
jgi:hypothetical protein